MTDKEKAIVMAHTGICMLAGDKFQIFHKYIEDVMGRPVMTHEIGFLADEIKEKTKADFIALCANESSSEDPNKWIPVSEKPPKDKQHCFVTKIIPGCKPIVKTATYSTNLYEVNKYEFADKKNIPGFYDYGSDGYFECTDVIAWMSLPKAYGGKEE